jgi:ribose 5-phosphate isomerase
VDCPTIPPFASILLFLHSVVIYNTTAADLIKLNLAVSILPKRVPWILDSEASTSVTGDTHTTVGGQTHHVTGRGHVVFDFNTPINEAVLYAHGVQKTLISVDSLTDQGLSVLFTRTYASILDTNSSSISCCPGNPTIGLY